MAASVRPRNTKPDAKTSPADSRPSATTAVEWPSSPAMILITASAPLIAIPAMAMRWPVCIYLQCSVPMVVPDHFRARRGMLFSERFHMSGHSKWATIKHKKAALDAKRGKTFTRLIKEITIAARNGGDPDGNPRLRTAILAAKAVSMPADNIKKAVTRGTGELEGGQIEEVMFEGYGPGGAAVLVNVATDNRNRTVSDIRHLFSKNGGNMGEQGSVAWMFERKSQIYVPSDKAGEDQLMGIVLDAGADDLRDDGDH